MEVNTYRYIQHILIFDVYSLASTNPRKSLEEPTALIKCIMRGNTSNTLDNMPVLKKKKNSLEE